MEYGICKLAVVPMRAEPSSRAEMVSQVLFGEVFKILERHNDWVKICTTTDNYEGWLNNLQATSIEASVYAVLTASSPALTFNPVTQARRNIDNSILYLPAGSSLVLFNGATCEIDSETFDIAGAVGNRASLELTARSFLNTPYLWGGRTHFGIDCSGFTQAVFRLQGISLQRDARQQAEHGQTVDFLQEGRPGDLAFFDNAESSITHVGILLGDEQIIHASGMVKTDRIDTNGIYSVELQRYTHKLRIIKRFDNGNL